MSTENDESSNTDANEGSQYCQIIGRSGTHKIKVITLMMPTPLESLSDHFVLNMTTADCCEHTGARILNAGTTHVR